MSRHRRQIVAALLGAALGLAVAARLARPAASPFVPVSATILALNATDETERTDSTGCGVERWAVKTMVDPQARQVRLAPTRTTVAALRRRALPVDVGGARAAPVELHAYKVTARLIAAKLEDDSDFHLVIADPRTGGTMIVEFPLLSCVHGGSAVVRRRVNAARAALIRACGQPSSGSFTSLQGTATVTGVGFFDFKHGQTGVAPNGVELHPVLGFSGSCR